jgi:hypothetical protein
MTVKIKDKKIFEKNTIFSKICGSQSKRCMSSILSYTAKKQRSLKISIQHKIASNDMYS